MSDKDKLGNNLNNPFSYKHFLIFLSNMDIGSNIQRIKKALCRGETKPSFTSGIGNWFLNGQGKQPGDLQTHI